MFRFTFGDLSFQIPKFGTCFYPFYDIFKKKDKIQLSQVFIYVYK